MAAPSTRREAPTLTGRLPARPSGTRPASDGAAGDGDGRWRRRPLVRILVLVLAGVLVAVAMTRLTRGGSGPPAAAPPAPVAVPQDIEHVAASLGCPPRQTARNSEFRQATCPTPSGRYTITTFASDRNQEDWLAEALPYGGAYLVGTRWVVNGDVADPLRTLAGRIGGRLVDQTGAHGH